MFLLSKIHNSYSFSTTQELSEKSGEAFVEKKYGKKRYFVKDSGWLSTSYKQVTKEEYDQRLESPSTLQKVLSVGLGILSLLHSSSEGGKGLLLGILGNSLSPIHANAQAAGLEFQVNTFTTDNQASPSIVPLKDGGFVVTWHSDGQDGNLRGIFAQKYNVNGSRSASEFQVNSYTTNDQFDPAIAPLKDGGFVSAWTSLGQDGNLQGIFAQRFDGNGAPTGSEFQVNTYTTNNQNDPAITGLTDGGFVIAWQSSDQDRDGLGIFGQKYDASGALSGPEFQINNFTIKNQQNPSIAPLIDAGFIVSWQSDGQTQGSFGVFGQRFDGNNTRLGSEFQVNSNLVNTHISPVAALLNDGGFVIAWRSDGQDGDGAGIFARRYDASAEPVDFEFQVNTYTTNNQIDPFVAALNDGGFIISWESDGQDGDELGVFGQRYDANGVPVPLNIQPPPSTNLFPAQTSSKIKTSSSSSQLNSTKTLESSRVEPLSVPGFFSSSINKETPSVGDNSNSTQSSRIDLLPLSNQIQLGSSSSLLTSNIRSHSPSQSSEILSAQNLVYGVSYSVFINGEVIGSYFLSGGTGSFDSVNTNTVTIQFDSNYTPSEGDILVLFTIPEGSEVEWEEITVENDSSECLEAKGEVQEDSRGSQMYQVIFEKSSSCTSTTTKLLKMPPLLVN